VERTQKCIWMIRPKIIIILLFCEHIPWIRGSSLWLTYELSWFASSISSWSFTIPILSSLNHSNVRIVLQRTFTRNMSPSLTHPDTSGIFCHELPSFWPHILHLLHQRQSFAVRASIRGTATCFKRDNASTELVDLAQRAIKSRAW